MLRLSPEHASHATVVGLICGAGSGFGLVCVAAVTGSMALFSGAAFSSLAAGLVAAVIGFSLGWSVTFAIGLRRSRKAISVDTVEELDGLVDLRTRGLITACQFEQRRREMQDRG